MSRSIVFVLTFKIRASSVMFLGFCHKSWQFAHLDLSFLPP
ncbi:hypothetical protein [Helicobacter sp.]|nr:hypothetical protein [Helicobacter sp.]